MIPVEPLAAYQSDAVTRRGAVLVDAPAGTALHDWLTGRRAVAALVRPDGTIMCAGRDVASICASTPAFEPTTRTDSTS